MTDLRHILVELIALARRERIGFLAAAIAYYAFVSVIPALLLIVVIATTVGGSLLAEQIQVATGSYLSAAGQDLVEDAVLNASGRAGATVVGLGILLWSALGVVRGLDTAFARIYGGGDRKGYLVRIRDTVVAGLGIGVSIATMVFVGSVIAAIPTNLSASVVGTIVLVVGLFVAFLPLFVVLPGRRMDVRAALPGTVVVTVGWVVLQWVFQLYISVAPRFELYGLIGAVLVLVTWFYVASMLLLLGAGLNVVIMAESGNRQRQGPPPRQ